MSTDDKIRQLYDTLDAEEIHPIVLSKAFPEFSPEFKNAFVAHLAQTYEPAPSGRVLARLPLILTDENREDMLTAFLANFHAADPAVRRASLYGLAQLKYPGMSDLALLSLRDPADAVLAAACDILFPRAQTDSRVLHLLQGVYLAHKDDPSFHMTLSVLRAHGLGDTP